MKRYTTYNINQRLNSIYRRGDQDEGSMKHIGHVLATLMSGHRWYQVADYSQPVGMLVWCGGLGRGPSKNQWEQVKKKWYRLEEIRGELGQKAFNTLIETTDFYFVAESYLDLYKYKKDVKTYHKKPNDSDWKDWANEFENIKEG